MRKVFTAVFLVLALVGPAHANAELNELRTHMRSKVDEIEGIKWIYDKATPQNIHNNMSYVYLGQRGKQMWGFLRLGFRRDNWVFFEKITLNADGCILDYPFYYNDVTRDYSTGGVWEYVDLPLEEYDGLALLIAESQKILIRFSGNKRKTDFEISKKQKDAIKRVLRLYELMR